jgi:hypothetical protein
MTAVFMFANASIAFAGNTPAPTFSKDVAPIFFAHCVQCHRPGQIAGAVQLQSYDTARPWARAIKEKVLTREMPPWPADPNASMKFRNDARLSPVERQTVVAWVSAGAPKGSDADLPFPLAVEQGWQHPKGLAPDIVLSLPGEFQAPAQGEIPYVSYLVKVPFSEDKWIAASQTRPGNRALVHHMAITEVQLSDGLSPADLQPLALLARQMDLSKNLAATRPAVTAPGNSRMFDMLGVYTPGTTIEVYEDGSAKLLKGGRNMYLNFNIHYQVTGKPERDRSMIAFWFQPEAPKHQLFRVPAADGTIIAAGRELLTDSPGETAEGTRVAIPPIPPHAGNYELIGVTAYAEPVTIYQFQPHAHVRGKDFRYAVVYPDGREETVLSVPKYNFNWQLAYELESPLHLPAGSKLVVTAHYDNSRNNKSNPAPGKAVDFREGQNQSTDEMFTPFIQYAIDSVDPWEQSQPKQPENRSTQDTASVVEVVGCLQQSAAGGWALIHAGDASVSPTQATSAAAVKAAGKKPLGNGRYQLLGFDVFLPRSHPGRRVVVKGVLVQDNEDSRLNVTSLQELAAGCSLSGAQ